MIGEFFKQYQNYEEKVKNNGFIKETEEKEFLELFQNYVPYTIYLPFQDLYEEILFYIQDDAFFVPVPYVTFKYSNEWRSVILQENVKCLKAFLASTNYKGIIICTRIYKNHCRIDYTTVSGKLY